MNDYLSKKKKLITKNKAINCECVSSAQITIFSIN